MPCNQAHLAGAPHHEGAQNSPGREPPWREGGAGPPPAKKEKDVMNSSSKTAPSNPYPSQARSASLKPPGISTCLSPEGKGPPCTPHPSAASMQFASRPQECDNVQEVQRNSPRGPVYYSAKKRCGEGFGLIILRETHSHELPGTRRKSDSDGTGSGLREPSPHLP